MNKLFTKVAALTLGVAMAAGVGVALGSANASKADAAEEVYKTALFGSSYNSKGVSSYTDSWSSTTNGFTVNLQNFNNNNNGWDLIKCGRKKPKTGSGASVATIITAEAIDKSITSVHITIDSITAANVNSIKLYSSSDGSSWVAETTQFTKATGDQSVSLASPSANKYYKVEFDCAEGSANGFVAVTKVEYYYDNGGAPTYSVSYDANATVNVTGSAPSAHTGLADGTTQTLETTTSLTRWGYTFGGWAATAESTTPITSVTIDGANATVYAIWTADLTVKGAHASNPYTIAEAKTAIDAGQHLKENYVSGIISQIDSYDSSHKSITYWISDDGATTNQLQVYSGKGLNSADFTALTDIALKATVTVCGTLKKYNSTYEFDHSNYQTSYTAPVDPSIALSVDYLSFIVGGDAQSFTVVPTSFSDVPTVTIEGASHVSTAVDGLTVSVLPTSVGNDTLVVKATNGTEQAQIELDVRVFATHGHVENDPYTVAEALALIASDTQYVFRDCYVKGLISQVVSYSSQYHSIDYDISDNGEKANELLIYSGKGLNGANFTSKEDLTVGYEVVVKGNLKYYSGTSEMDKNSVQISYEAPAPTLESIAVSGEYKTKYGYQAEEFDKEGIVVTATYSDQSQQSVDLADVQFSGYDKSVLGEQTVTVTYQEKTTSFKVTVYYTATYKPGEGTPEDGEYVGYIENPDNYELVSFEQTGFVAPTGKQFKEWSQGTTGKVVVSANGNLNFTAVYEDIPVAKYSVTYTAGQGTGDNYVVSDVEAGSLHALVTFETAAFTAPEGQQFKGWQVGDDTELRAAGYEVTVSGDVTVIAIYEDIPATDWSETFKTTFQSKFGTTYLPPFVNAEFANESNQKWHSTYPYCKIEVEGNFYSNAATLFNNDSNWIFLGYDEYDCPIFMTSDKKAFVIIDAYMKVQDGPVYTSLTFECVGDYAVVTTGAKTEYFVGDNLDLTNVKLCAQLLDGTIVNNLTIPQSYWSVSPTTLTEAGDEVVITIAVAALEAEFTYNVKVTPVMVESISISGELSKTEYAEGDAWDATGLVATAHYNNGAEADVTDQVTWSFDPAETAVEVTSVSVVAHLDELSSDAVVFDVTVQQAYGADAFAKDLLEMVAPICANYDGKKNNKAALKTVWDTMSQRYSTLSNEEKAKVIAAAAKADGTDLEKAMAFYNYACKKYGLTKFIEGRQVKALVAEHETGNSILPIVVIVASSVAAITAIGVVIALKRRKALLAK